MKDNTSFDTLLSEWKNNPRYTNRNANQMCVFSERKTSPFWCIYDDGWYSGGFTTSFMFNHKNYVIQLVLEDVSNRGKIVASAALPGKTSKDFTSIFDLWKWMNDNKGIALEDKDVSFTTINTISPMILKGEINTSDKVALYINPDCVEMEIEITQVSPYRHLLRGEVPLTNDLDMTQVIAPFISDEMFVIELITRAEANYKKTKEPLVGTIRDVEDK